MQLGTLMQLVALLLAPAGVELLDFRNCELGETG